MFNKKRRSLLFVLVFLIVIHTTNAIVNQSTNSLQIIGFSEKISPSERHEIFINESEFYKNKKRTFEVGLPSHSIQKL